MTKTGVSSIIANGTKVWLDSVDPDLIKVAIASGSTGATSNPIIITDLIKTGRFDASIEASKSKMSAEELAWSLTNELVTAAESSYRHIWERTSGDDGYVSFELDPLIEDPSRGLSVAEGAKQYVELAKKWSVDHPNRLIKVPATPSGIASLEDMVAAGINVNVTLIFTPRQYTACRDAVWAGAQKRSDLSHFKSVYSIFVSRVDVYTKKHVSELTAAAQGQVALLNAKQIWQCNTDFWKIHPTPLKQEMVFASTGTKDPSLDADFYVASLVGSDIQTNPPTTNAAVESAAKTYHVTIDQLPSAAIQSEVAEKVDLEKLETVLMEEGLAKFCVPQQELLALISSRV